MRERIDALETVVDREINIIRNCTDPARRTAEVRRRLIQAMTVHFFFGSVRNDL